MLSAKNISARKIHFDDFRLISPSDFDNEDRRTQVAPGNVLLTIVGAIGRSAVVPEGIDSFTLQRSVAVLKPTVLNSRFLSYALEAPAIQKYLNDNAKGTAQKGIYLKALSEVEVPVPPPTEQQRIADKLDTVLARVDAVNDRLARVAPLLKRFRQSVLAAATSGRLTADWREANQLKDLETKTLGDLIKVSSGDGLTSKEMNSEGDVPVFGGNGINGKHTVANTHEPTIVIGRVGYYCGSVHLTPPRAWITDNALRVKFDPSVLSIHFLYCGLMGANLRANISSTAQPLISGQKIYPIEFLLPTLDEQSEIVRRVDLLFAFADRLEARLQAAQTASSRLTPALLAKAFRGELVPQDPNDEPAAELLKRLAQSKPEPTKKPRARKATA